MPEKCHSPFVDTHCHIDSVLERDQIGWEQLWERMAGSMPEKLIHVACHPDNLEWALTLCANVDCAYACFGIHPHEASLYNSDVESRLRTCLAHPKALALGEIGLDYHYDYSPREQQRTVFARQLELARELGKPVVLHTREADADTLEILRAHDGAGLRIHVHCYTGSAAFARELLALQGDFFFGFTGVLTFKNAESVREAARAVPRERLLLETDSPYLAPVPWRGKTAHPGMIPAIAAALAEARGEDVAELMGICRENTRNFYGI